jgi:hypothetical protein
MFSPGQACRHLIGFPGLETKSPVTTDSGLWEEQKRPIRGAERKLLEPSTAEAIPKTLKRGL